MEGISRTELNKDKKMTKGDETKIKNSLGKGKALQMNTKKILDSEPKVKIKIHSGEGDLNKEPVFLSINANAYRIKRDTWVEVPESVYQLLKNTDRQVVYQDEEKKVHERTESRFSVETER